MPLLQDGSRRPNWSEPRLPLRQLIRALDQSSGSGHLSLLMLTTIEGNSPSSTAKPCSHQVDLRILGMTCSSCVFTLESNLIKVPGVISASVSLATQSGRFTIDPDQIGLRSLISAVEDLGFDAELIKDGQSHVDIDLLTHRSQVKQWKQAFLFNLLFSAPSMLLMMYWMYFSGHGHHTQDHGHHMEDNNNSTMASKHKHEYFIIPGLSTENLVMLLLATPVQIFGARYFYSSAWKSVKHGSANMDVLVVLASGISFIYSVIVLLIAIFTGGVHGSPKTFLETPPMLLTFVSFGRWLEHIAKGQTSEALTKLIGLQPAEAILLEGYKEGSWQKEVKVDVQLVQKGDFLKVLPDCKVPVDGIVVSGTSTCDESLITGESLPVIKGPGSTLVGGSTNQSGLIVMRASAVGDQTILAQIVKLVEQAQNSKAPIQAFADRIASYFVPSILILATSTLAFWVLVGFYSGKYLHLIRSHYHYHEDASDGISFLVFGFAFECALTGQ